MVKRKPVLFVHVARMARDSIRRLGWETLRHPPHCPDRTPTNYHLFHSVNNYVRGKSFANGVDLWQALTDFYAFKRHDFYRYGIARLEVRWQKFLDIDRDYFYVMSNLLYNFFC